MGWRGIANLPPGFDALSGKEGQLTVVDRAIRGDIKGLSPSQREQFKDLKRHLLHMDFARYFESSLFCAQLLEGVEEGRYGREIVAEIVEPALTVAIGQLESVRADVVKATASHRRMEYDPVSSLDQLHSKSRPLSVAYPHAEGAARLDPAYEEVSKSIRQLLSDPGASR